VFCSTIIPTIGRASLARAVQSVLAQTCAEPFEVIVVNDAPTPLRVDWPESPYVRIIATGGQGRSAARNAGAAVAQGRYLNFLDDDDWLLPGALTEWRRLAQHSPAAWLYGATQLTDAAGTVLLQFRHGLSGNCLVPAMTGEWIPIQASAIRAEAFAALHGFDTSLHISEDKDLLARLCLREAVAGTDTPVAGILRGTWESTTDYGVLVAETQRSREALFAQPGAWARMRASAGTPYWRGKLLRAYAISAVWNARHRQPARALQRAGIAGLCALLAGPDLLRPTYWRAVLRGHLTPGFVPPPSAA
jgi:hypothetical protein